MTFEEKYQQILEEIHKGEAICPIMYAVSMIGQKWKIPILWQLAIHEKPMRFCELRRSLEGVTDAMLSRSLDELEQNGLIERIQYDCIPPKVEYTLARKGKALMPTLVALRDWAQAEIDEECSKAKKAQQSGEETE